MVQKMQHMLKNIFLKISNKVNLLNLKLRYFKIKIGRLNLCRIKDGYFFFFYKMCIKVLNIQQPLSVTSSYLCCKCLLLLEFVLSAQGFLIVVSTLGHAKFPHGSEIRRNADLHQLGCPCSLHPLFSNTHHPCPFRQHYIMGNILFTLSYRQRYCSAGE